MKIKDIKPGLKPFFIFVILFEAVYVIVVILLGFPMMIIADKIRMHKHFKNRVKTNRKQDELNENLRK